MAQALITARCDHDFGPGPFAIAFDEDPRVLAPGARLLVAFADCELLLTVIARPRRGLQLGGFVTPWEYFHWRAQPREGKWFLETADRARLAVLKRRHGLPG